MKLVVASRYGRKYPKNSPKHVKGDLTWERKRSSTVFSTDPRVCGHHFAWCCPMLTEILPFSGNCLHEAVLQERQRSHCGHRPKNANVMAQSYSALSLMTLLSRIPSLCLIFFVEKRRCNSNVFALFESAAQTTEKGSHDVRRHMCEGFCGGILNSVELPCFGISAD